MGGNHFIYAFVGALAIMLIAAAWSDIKQRIITNRLNAAIALLAVPYWFEVGLRPWPDMALQVGIAVACFGLFYIPFLMRKMGAGDVKFITAIVLWLPSGFVLPFIIIMSFAGAVLTIFMIVYQRIKHKNWRPKVPYGVSIAAGGLWASWQLLTAANASILHQQYINQFM